MTTIAHLTADSLKPAALHFSIDEVEALFLAPAIEKAEDTGDIASLFSCAISMVQAALGCDHVRIDELRNAWDAALEASIRNHEDEGALMLQDAAALAALIIRDDLYPAPAAEVVAVVGNNPRWESCASHDQTFHSDAEAMYFAKGAYRWATKASQSIPALCRSNRRVAHARVCLILAYRAITIDKDARAALYWSSVAHGISIALGAFKAPGWELIEPETQG